VPLRERPEIQKVLRGKALAGGREEESMELDLQALYARMLRSRLFEEAVAQLWHEGLISGEMHLGTGEEGIVAGVLAHVRDGDALAVDHRGTAALLMRGIDPILLLREFLGRPDGLCHGMGGHMHLFSQQHLAASSGIAGASGPAAVGFALAAHHLRPGTVAVALFGEGATNQGMLMEALNLAVVWRLPVLFVCKDNDWAVMTESTAVTGGDLTNRARSFGLLATKVDGADVEAVWHAAREAVGRARGGDGPSFLHATCVHLEGHFLGDPLVRVTRRPVQEMMGMAGPLTRAAVSWRGTSMRERVAGVRAIMGLILRTYREQGAGAKGRDPLVRARGRLALDEGALQALETNIADEVQAKVRKALEPVADLGEDGE
jgi:TPP-dependent pyruvate/acetoin dehydrogenase alpha subunit